MEISNFSKYVPKFINGFDVDELYQKALYNKPMTKEEETAICVAFDIFHESGNRAYLELKKEMKNPNRTCQIMW